MTMIEVEDPRATSSYWVGWLASALAEAVRDIASGNPDALERALHNWQPFIDSPCGRGFEHLDESLPAGWIVEAADGEAQAMRDTEQEAALAVASVEAHYYDAETCGHPDAAGWVAAKRPWRVRPITRGERDELREYPPVIDREP